MFALLPALLGAEASPRGQPSRALGTAIANGLSYKPPPPAKPEKQLATVGATIRMPSLIVPANPLPRDQARVIDANNQRIRAARFTPVSGGTLVRKDLGRARLELDGWLDGAGLALVRLSW